MTQPSTTQREGEQGRRAPRSIIVACGGRELPLPERIPTAPREGPMLRIYEALHRRMPTHFVVGSQRGGDKIWQRLLHVWAIPCQQIRVEPSSALAHQVGGPAFSARTHLLWEIAAALLRADEEAHAACYALPGRIGTALCKRLAGETAQKLRRPVEITDFRWHPKGAS